MCERHSRPAICFWDRCVGREQPGYSERIFPYHYGRFWKLIWCGAYVFSWYLHCIPGLCSLPISPTSLHFHTKPSAAGLGAWVIARSQWDRGCWMCVWACGRWTHRVVLNASKNECTTDYGGAIDKLHDDTELDWVSLQTPLCLLQERMSVIHYLFF